MTAASLDVAIIGAGPYGLSIAAHLRAARVEHRIFGAPMQAWADHMPAGMHLKTDASSSARKMTRACRRALPSRAARGRRAPKRARCLRPCLGGDRLPD